MIDLFLVRGSETIAVLIQVAGTEESGFLFVFFLVLIESSELNEFWLQFRLLVKE